MAKLFKGVDFEVKRIFVSHNEMLTPGGRISLSAGTYVKLNYVVSLSAEEVEALIIF